jgi:primosomal protein N' (replication factor Y) (superfamily II helicase)
MNYFIEVIIPLSLAKTFTYRVSDAEFQYIQKGMRVAVPFGKNKIYTALVIDLHQNAPTLYEAKEIHQIIDEKPLVNSFQLAHWQWIADYYICSIGEVYRCAVPSAFLLESETVITTSKSVQVDQSVLTDEEYLIYMALQNQAVLKIQEIAQITNRKNVFPVLQAMMQKQVIVLNEEISETYKPKTIRYIRLALLYQDEVQLIGLLDSLQKAVKQKEVLLHFFQLQAKSTSPISIKQLTEASGATSAVIKALIDKGIFEDYFLQTDRVSFAELQQDLQLTLSAAQQLAYASIEQEFTKQEVVLLHGITGSGKTELYIQLIESYLYQGKQIVFLVPEIALTTQLVSRLTAYFGNKVAVFHSKYSNNERVEVWNQVLSQSEKAQIVIGARSALFLPFSNLGLVLVDEEHEQTFKQQDPAPRYHARDAAIVLAKSHQAKVLLGSATPSLESYYNAQVGKYGKVLLSERYGNAQLPEIELVDLKDAYFRKKMTGHFSAALLEAISTALAAGEQVILFQNRRGFSPIITCDTCGHVPHCVQCDVSLTYHKHKNQLRCHYCGYAMANPSSCHACSSAQLSTKGFGTEQIQQELQELFPETKIGRMDQDTTGGKHGFENLLDKFKHKEFSILVGTQMLAKGLDFSNVSLVGIMNADAMLYHPDFRAFERSFQLMTQVAGRAGRAQKLGKVMIQTYTPQHPVIQQVCQNDYAGMYADQIKEREVFQYPPFYRLIKITLKHRDYDKLKQGSIWLYQMAKQNLSMPVLGPEEPVISRIRNEYLRVILIKIPPKASLASTKKTVQKMLDSFERVGQFKAIKVALNVDHY